MSQLVPHLFLLADTATSRTATVLRTAGYMVDEVSDWAMAERVGNAPDVDGVVIELPAMAAIAVVRRIEEYRRDVSMIVIVREAETVRRALPRARVIRPEEIDDDLVSTVDMALVAQQMRSTG